MIPIRGDDRRGRSALLRSERVCQGSGTRRSRGHTVCLLACMVSWAGCSGRPEPERSEAPPTQSFAGFVNTIVGDPAPPGGAPQFFASLTTSEGRTLSLTADSAHAALLTELPRFGGRRVSVVGRFRGVDTTMLWIERVDSAGG